MVAPSIANQIIGSPRRDPELSFSLRMNKQPVLCNYRCRDNEVRSNRKEDPIHYSIVSSILKLDPSVTNHKNLDLTSHYYEKDEDTVQ